MLIVEFNMGKVVSTGYNLFHAHDFWVCILGATPYHKPLLGFRSLIMIRNQIRHVDFECNQFQERSNSMDPTNNNKVCGHFQLHIGI